jgi:Domain of unknown function (DUF4965)
VEVLYAAFPMFLYFDSSLGGLLLEPLLRYQAWPNVNPQYTARDAGKLYLYFWVPGARLYKFIIRNIVPEYYNPQ